MIASSRKNRHNTQLHSLTAWQLPTIKKKMKKYVGLVFILVSFIIGNEYVGSDNLKVHFIDVREGVLLR